MPMMILFHPQGSPLHRFAFMGSVTPHARLLATGLLVSACLLAPATSPGFLLIVLVTGLHVAASGMSWPQIRRLAALYVLGYLPFVASIMLLSRFGPGISGTGGEMGWMLEGSTMLLKGGAVIGNAASSVATMNPADFEEGLRRIVRLQLVGMLAMQILQQTGILIAETKRISQAMAVRSGSAGGKGLALLVRCFPVVWLPRMVHKAERVTAAMDVREFTDASFVQAPRRLSGKDWVVLIFCLLTFGASGALRVLRLP